jgi:hypothetical protein
MGMTSHEGNDSSPPESAHGVSAMPATSLFRRTKSGMLLQKTQAHEFIKLFAIFIVRTAIWVQEGWLKWTVQVCANLLPAWRWLILCRAQYWID